ncbi:MAG: subtilase family serine protease [Marinobacter excellens HL-55]|uniref:Subtilase family serine protease n=1 Tax=Marinobacter excellens HL-55 TaxID=1305731 RepID=A0A0P7ZAH2_9GAMM|nr:MAG: subtilase family serine protease [Marinobacter excellens HL-55]
MTKTRLYPMIMLSALVTATAAPTQVVASESVEGPGRLVVTYRDTVSALSIGQTMASSEIIEVGAENIAAVKAQLASLPEVAVVEEDVWVSNPPMPVAPRLAEPGTVAFSAQTFESAVSASSIPSDPGFSSQIAWQSPSSIKRGVQDIFAAYLRSTFEKRVRIGVVDSGFHQLDDLKYAQGFNFASDDGYGPRYLENEVAPVCLNAHGTGVSGVLGAITDNGTGIAGIAKADIVAARALSCDSSGRVRGALTDTALAIRWLAGDPSVTQAPRLQQSVDVINVSLGAEVSSCPVYLQQAIDYAWSRGVLTVVAAGNAGQDAASTAPANCQRVVTVGAVRSSGDLSGFSNTGTSVNVAALGSEVLSLDRFGRLTFWDGTSFSAPVVAGIAGLLKQSSAEPLAARDLTELLVSTSRLVAQSDGSRIPIVDARAAMDRIQRQSGNEFAQIERFLSSSQRRPVDAFIKNNPLNVELDRVFEVTVSGARLSSSTDRFVVFQTTTSGSKIAIAQSREPVFLLKNVDPAVDALWIDLCDRNAQNCRFDRSKPLL